VQLVRAYGMLYMFFLYPLCTYWAYVTSREDRDGGGAMEGADATEILCATHSGDSNYINVQ